MVKDINDFGNILFVEICNLVCNFDVFLMKKGVWNIMMN